jgi:hypothetical protein
MKLLDSLYYQYYLYSKKFLKDEEPFAMANWVFSCTVSFFLNGVIAFIVAKYFCFDIEKWFMISLSLVILLTGYLYYNRSGRSKRIVLEKPLLFDSTTVSTTFAIIFFLISVSWLFWGVIYWPKCN